jgi:repressor LexA
MDPLSPRQTEVLNFISSTIRNHGIPPTYREIGDALSIASTNGVADHVKALVRKGHLEKVGSGSARGLRLSGPTGPWSQGDTVSVPVVGLVAAGAPILAVENHERTIHIDRSMVRDGGVMFALRVRGDSMIEEGILDGDTVVVRQQSTARNGDIVVALINDEATVKFYFHEGERVRLQPAHPTMRPIFVDRRDNATIQGVVVGVMRQY